MTPDIVRAWKDESYRQSLSQAQQHTLPANPAGHLELGACELAAIYGGGSTATPFFPDDAQSFQFEDFLHSFALVCDEAKFSITAMKGVATTSPITIICVNGDIH
ncbi:MAG TPA: mersacidin/lichenicidin family type 2 lantibiotic [Ktedonobacteraceae bacterium]|jgi:mersacidin/lichenicidin family type 2 lantibiotic